MTTLNLQQQQHQQAPPPISGSVDDRFMWRSVIDPRTGAPYYCNMKTGKTQWTPPPDALIIPYLPPQQPALPGVHHNGSLPQPQSHHHHLPHHRLHGGTVTMLSPRRTEHHRNPHSPIASASPAAMVRHSHPQSLQNTGTGAFFIPEETGPDHHHHLLPTAVTGKERSMKFKAVAAASPTKRKLEKGEKSCILAPVPVSEAVDDTPALNAPNSAFTERMVWVNFGKSTQLAFLLSVQGNKATVRWESTKLKEEVSLDRVEEMEMNGHKKSRRRSKKFVSAGNNNSPSSTSNGKPINSIKQPVACTPATNVSPAVARITPLEQEQEQPPPLQPTLPTTTLSQRTRENSPLDEGLPKIFIPDELPQIQRKSTAAAAPPPGPELKLSETQAAEESVPRCTPKPRQPRTATGRFASMARVVRRPAESLATHMEEESVVTEAKTYFTQVETNGVNVSAKSIDAMVGREDKVVGNYPATDAHNKQTLQGGEPTTIVAKLDIKDVAGKEQEGKNDVEPAAKKQKVSLQALGNHAKRCENEVAPLNPNETLGAKIVVTFDKQEGSKLGVSLTAMNEKILITKVEPGGLIESTDLKAGMEIHSINNVIIPKVLTEAANMFLEASGSTTVVAFEGPCEQEKGESLPPADEKRKLNPSNEDPPAKSKVDDAAKRTSTASTTEEVLHSSGNSTSNIPTRRSTRNAKSVYRTESAPSTPKPNARSVSKKTSTNNGSCTKGASNNIVTTRGVAKKRKRSFESEVNALEEIKALKARYQGEIESVVTRQMTELNGIQQRELLAKQKEFEDYEAEREASLEQWEATLEKRETIIEEKEALLERKQALLAKARAGLLQKKVNLDMRERDVLEREAELDSYSAGTLESYEAMDANEKGDDANDTDAASVNESEHETTNNEKFIGSNDEQQEDHSSRTKNIPDQHTKLNTTSITLSALGAVNVLPTDAYLLSQQGHQTTQKMNGQSQSWPGNDPARQVAQLASPVLPTNSTKALQAQAMSPRTAKRWERQVAAPTEAAQLLLVTPIPSVTTAARAGHPKNVDLSRPDVLPATGVVTRKKNGKAKPWFKSASDEESEDSVSTKRELPKALNRIYPQPDDQSSSQASTASVVPTKKDAIFGRGRKKSAVRTDNLYRRLIEAMCHVYAKLNVKDFSLRRQYVKDKIVDPILKDGGRFIMRDGVSLKLLNVHDKGDLRLIYKKVQRALFNERKRRECMDGEGGGRVATARASALAFTSSCTAKGNARVDGAGIEGLDELDILADEPEESVFNLGFSFDDDFGEDDAMASADSAHDDNESSLVESTETAHNLALPRDLDLDCGNIGEGQAFDNKGMFEKDGMTSDLALSSAPRVIGATGVADITQQQMMAVESIEMETMITHMF